MRSLKVKAKKVCFDGEPDLQRIMTGDFSLLENGPINSVKNKEEILRWTWEAWRLAVGPTIATVYPEAVAIMNAAALDNHYHDIGVVWREELEIENLESLAKQLLVTVHPLYNLIHAVVRGALRKMYPNVPNFGPSDPIPAHLLGNMWSQNWEPMLEYILTNTSLRTRFERSGWSPKEMAKKADDFYSSLGLPAMNRQFWANSNFEKTRNVTKCHGTAADMYGKEDFR
jgi:peptidyl-dipeptidase A